MGKILFLAKTTDWCNNAVQYMQKHFRDDAEIVQGVIGDPFPSELNAWKGDYVISYLSPWIVPSLVLQAVRKAAINFHPAPPEYPGTGCYNFALYEGANEYGVTCHHMVEKVDSGAIVAVKRFSIVHKETVASLKEKSMQAIWELFLEIMDYIAHNQPLPQSDLHWTRGPFTRKQLNELCRITPDMDEKEVARRVRSTYFPGAPGPYLEIGDYRFEYKP